MILPPTPNPAHNPNLLHPLPEPPFRFVPIQEKGDLSGEVRGDGGEGRGGLGLRLRLRLRQGSARECPGGRGPHRYSSPGRGGGTVATNDDFRRLIRGARPIACHIPGAGPAVAACPRLISAVPSGLICGHGGAREGSPRNTLNTREIRKPFAIRAIRGSISDFL
jgi:hypothetical protein